MASLTPAAIRSLIVPQPARQHAWIAATTSKKNGRAGGGICLIAQPSVAESDVAVETIRGGRRGYGKAARRVLKTGTAAPFFAVL
jgi:hypothetical protein